MIKSKMDPGLRQGGRGQECIIIRLLMPRASFCLAREGGFFSLLIPTKEWGSKTNRLSLSHLGGCPIAPQSLLKTVPESTSAQWKSHFGQARSYYEPPRVHKVVSLRCNPLPIRNLLFGSNLASVLDVTL